jgi:hypothetical protein
MRSLGSSDGRIGFAAFCGFLGLAAGLFDVPAPALAELPTHLLGLLREDLARRLNVEPDSIKLFGREEVVWSNGCLGLPAPELCSQAPVPGYRVILEAMGRQYTYHTDTSDAMFRFAGLNN